jgi:uncharacterized membrane protein
MLFQSARKSFLRGIDPAAVEAATRRAEEGTTGEIRVSILPRQLGSLAGVAERTAARLGMTRTAERNGVLILVEPARRRFVLWGDRAIHEKVGEDFWKGAADSMAERFRKGDFTGGLVHGVESVGRQLAAHFPSGSEGHVNQLPDGIDIGARKRD